VARFTAASTTHFTPKHQPVEIGAKGQVAGQFSMIR